MLYTAYFSNISSSLNSISAAVTLYSSNRDFCSCSLENLKLVDNIETLEVCETPSEMNSSFSLDSATVESLAFFSSLNILLVGL